MTSIFLVLNPKSQRRMSDPFYKVGGAGAVISCFSNQLRAGSLWLYLILPGVPKRSVNYFCVFLFSTLKHIPSVPFPQNFPSSAPSEQFVLLAATELFSGAFCHHHHAESLTPPSPHSCFHFGKAHPLVASEKRSMKGKVSKASHFFKIFIRDDKRK